MFFIFFKKNTVKSLFGGVITNNVVSLVSILPVFCFLKIFMYVLAYYENLPIFDYWLTRIVNMLVRLLKSFILWGARWLIWRIFMWVMYIFLNFFPVFQLFVCIHTHTYLYIYREREQASVCYFERKFSCFHLFSSCDVTQIRIKGRPQNWFFLIRI